MSTLRQRFERPLVVIFVLVSLVLVIACANIANLLLARGVARRHELSVRVALGASRWRLVRQLIAESLLLSSVGAAIGLVLASWVTRVLLSQVSSARAPIVLETAVDWRVLAFTVTTMMVTAMLFGTAPALRLTDVVPTEAMRQGRGTIGHRRGAVSHSLVVVQIVLSLLLVVGAGLFVRTFERLVRVSLGFDPDRTLVVTVAAPTVPADDRPMLFHRLAEAVRTVPGVTAVGGALNPPIIGGLAGDLVVSAPGTAPQPDAERIPQFDSITPGWFAGYGIPIERGRDFDERDRIGAPPVMLVNDAFVRRLFPGRDVIGMPLTMTFRLAIGDFPYGVRTIVGVVADSVFRSLRDPVRPMIYVPLAQRESIPQKDMYLGVRSASGSPALLERSVAAAITAFSRDVAFTFQPLAQQVDESLANDRVMAMLSGFFGGLALLLAALGLYGVTAYGVAQRRAEIGIRMALGAAPANIMRLVLTRVSLLVSVGVAVGALTSIWASNFVSAMLFGLEPRDPATLVGAIAILAATGSIAGWLPADRASRIDPSEVLRDA
jgi:predicted permease